MKKKLFVSAGLALVTLFNMAFSALPAYADDDDDDRNCIVTDLKGDFVHGDGKMAASNPVTGFLSNVSGDPECPSRLWVHIFGSYQIPETEGWLENQEYVNSDSFFVPAGTSDMKIEVLVQEAGYCSYQGDLVDTPEVKDPPYYITRDYFFWMGDESACKKAPPKDPDRPVCPTCGLHRDEFQVEGDDEDHAVIFITSETPCKICWDEENEQWLNGLTPYSGVYATSQQSVLDLRTRMATPLKEFADDPSGVIHYLLTGEDITDHSWRNLKLLDGYHEGQLSWWDINPDNPDRILSTWEVVGLENVRIEYPCGRQPGWWDVSDGMFNWDVGHNVSEVSLWARNILDISYTESVDWARQLSQAGVGSSLALPGTSTALVETPTGVVQSPDGSREAFLRDGNLWIRWTFERTDDLPQEWDTGVAIESVDSWSANWVITITTQNGESYQTDQFASFVNAVDVST